MDISIKSMELSILSDLQFMESTNGLQSERGAESQTDCDHAVHLHLLEKSKLVLYLQDCFDFLILQHCSHFQIYQFS